MATPLPCSPCDSIITIDANCSLQYDDHTQRTDTEIAPKLPNYLHCAGGWSNSSQFANPENFQSTSLLHIHSPGGHVWQQRLTNYTKAQHIADRLFASKKCLFRLYTIKFRTLRRGILECPRLRLCLSFRHDKHPILWNQYDVKGNYINLLTHN